MLDQGATEAEADTYLSSEGITPETLRTAPLDLPLYEEPAQPPRNSTLDNVSATAQEALEGLLPGAGGFMAGVGGAIGNTIAAPLSDKVDWDPFAAFKEAQDASAGTRKQLEEEHPTIANTAWGLGLAGGLALPQAQIARGSSLAAGAANGALNAGAYGALSGALNDTGDGRLANAALGGLAGGALGAAAPVAFTKLADTVAAARRNVPGADATARFLENLPRRAMGRPLAQPGDAARAQGERILADELPQGTIATGMGTGNTPSTPENIAVEVARRQRMNVPAMPMDVSEQGRRITSWALQGNGPMTTRARNTLMARQAQLGARVRRHIGDELGAPVDPIQAVEDINRRASAAARPGYDAAYAQPMLVTPEIERIMQTPAFRNALPQAVENIRNAMRDPQELGFRLHADGSIEGANTLTVEGFDQVIRAMRDAGQAAMDTSGFRPRNTTNSVHINARERDLRRHLADQNDPYRAVTANYADEMALRDAMQNGQDVAGLTGPEIAGQMRDMPQHAQEAWMAGARTALAQDATKAGLKPTANVAQRTRQSLGLSGGGGFAAPGDPAKLQAIEAMSGRPGVMNRLDDRLEAEDQGFKAFHESFGNSKSQPRKAMDEALSGDALNSAGRAITGDLSGLLTGWLLKGNPRGTLRFKRDVQDRIAELMTETRPGNVQEAMLAIMQRAQHDADFADTLNRAGIRPAQIAAMLAASQDADPVSSFDEAQAY